ncbi:MAG: hypothetical protein JWO88_2958 [Frankiales bacterium]|nr:hypothetical protein [Frankiales bacterium]
MRRSGLVVALLVAALSGCSGSSSAPTPSAVASPSPSPSPAPSPSPSPSPTPSATPAPSPSVTAHARLTGDGIDLPTAVLVFGTTFEKARAALQQTLGTPTRDTGVGSSFGEYGTCPGTKLRALEYGGGALVVLFGNVKGATLTMYQWALQPKGNPARVPKASAFVGDVTTYEFGIGTTVRQLEAHVATGMLKVTPGNGSQAATFTLHDQSSGFSGQLSGTSGGDATTYVLAGQLCGE